jgi:hypothetical protein
MRGWFGPQPGSNVGYHGVWARYDVMPVTWEGWAATGVYIALQAIVVFIAFQVASQVGLWIVLAAAAVFALHVGYRWFASRHYVSDAEIDPTVLPSDMRE